MNHKFKVGDLVKCVAPTSFEGMNMMAEDLGGSGWMRNVEFTIKSTTENLSRDRVIYWGDDVPAGVYEEYLELVRNNGRKKMSQLNDVPKRLADVLKPGQKALYKLGYLTNNLNPSTDGRAAMMEMLWDQHVAELEKLAVAEVKQIMKEEKNDTK